MDKELKTVWYNIYILFYYMSSFKDEDISLQCSISIFSVKSGENGPRIC